MAELNENDESIINNDLNAAAAGRATIEEQAASADSLNNDMLNAGRGTFASIEKGNEEAEEVDASNLTDENINKASDGDDSAGSENYKNDSTSEEDAVRARRLRKVAAATSEYFKNRKAKKYENLSFSTSDAWEKPDGKTLGAVKGNLKNAKEKIEMFDKLHAKFVKYFKWSFLVCLICPFVIPAMAGLFMLFGGGVLTHEVACQRTYRRAIRPLSKNGRNPYWNMHYSKGMKKIEEQLFPDDAINKLLANTKDDKARNKMLGKVAENNIKNEMDNQQAAEAQNEQSGKGAENNTSPTKEGVGQEEATQVQEDAPERDGEVFGDLGNPASHETAEPAQDAAGAETIPEEQPTQVEDPSKAAQPSEQGDDGMGGQ